jgi:hypothetical protein
MLTSRSCLKATVRLFDRAVKSRLLIAEMQQNCDRMIARLKNYLDGAVEKDSEDFGGTTLVVGGAFQD